MASNPYVNKVQKADGTTIIDISDTTATASDVLTGKYFYLATGQKVPGTNTGGSGDGYVWQDGNGFVHLSDEEGTQTIIDPLTVDASGTYTAQTGHAYSPVTVPSGTAGTPSASKGTVSNHSVTVTPSVTNQTGWITGSTKTGTGVSVSASELVSGTYSVTSSGTKDVTNYASASVPAGSVTAPSSISGSSATVSTGTNTLTLSKTVSVTPSVTTAGYVSSGTAGNSTVSLTASVNTRSSSDLSASGATVTAPAGYYASSASKSVASGTEGTPTATKGTVSSNSVTVTPSVTNTAGYISGGTHTGTGVTVSASELVSGSETKTTNGTYDVTNLAQIVVNVSGGGSSGLVYETGTWTPSQDVAEYIISFTNTHTEAPFFYLISDTTDTYSSDLANTNYGVIYVCWEQIFGVGMHSTSTQIYYGRSNYSYRGTSASATISGQSSNLTQPSSNTGSSYDNYPRFWATETGIKACTNTSSRYWRTGRTYKWIAAWCPTT